MALSENLQQAVDNRKKSKLDPVSAAALDVVKVEQMQELAVLNEQEEKERRIAECHQIIGRIQGVNLVAKFADVGSLVWLKQVKESKLYRDLPGIGSWDKFCNCVGLSRSKVDEDIVNLATFGEEFLAAVGSFSVGYRELRKLRRLTSEGTLQITDNEVVIGDEHIPFSADNREDLEAALERLIEAKDQLIEEKAATIRANEKIISSKQELIHRQEKDLARYEKEAEAKGLTDPEKVYIQKVQNARITIEGFFNQFDPHYNPLPDDASPRMKQELMLTLQAFVRSTRASFDTAADLYGDPDLDGGNGWVPPNLRDEAGSEG